MLSNSQNFSKISVPEPNSSSTIPAQTLRSSFSDNQTIMNRYTSANSASMSPLIMESKTNSGSPSFASGSTASRNEATSLIPPGMSMAALHLNGHSDNALSLRLVCHFFQHILKTKLPQLCSIRRMYGHKGRQTKADK